MLCKERNVKMNSACTEDKNNLAFTSYIETKTLWAKTVSIIPEGHQKFNSISIHFAEIAYCRCNLEGFGMISYTGCFSKKGYCFSNWRHLAAKYTLMKTSSHLNKHYLSKNKRWNSRMFWKGLGRYSILYNLRLSDYWVEDDCIL